MATDIAKLSMQISVNGAERAKAALKGLQDGSLKAEIATQKLESTVKRASTSAFRPMGSVIQQAGYQIGDFATQVAAGQSAMVAFAQQGSQLAGLFGPGGAVLGAVIAIGGAIAGGLVRAFGSGERATEDLAEKMRELAKELGTVTDRQRDIINTGYAKTIAEQTSRIEELRAEIYEANRTAETFYNNQIRAGVPASVIEGSSAWKSLTERVQSARDEIALAEGVIASTRKEQEEFWKSLDTGGRSIDKTEDKVESMIASLRAQADTLGMTAREVALYQADQLEAAGANVDALRKQINATYDLVEAEEARKAAMQEQATLQRQLNALLGTADPLADFASKWAIVQQGLSAGLIDEAQAQRIMDTLTQAGSEAGERASEEFRNPWDSTAQSVAQSLQDAIASGDWGSIGDAIGSALSTSIAGMVSQALTQSIADKVTANSSALAQLGAAFAGPIAGAVAGGIAQVAIAEISDYFRDDWDPTAARQAAQGTGTVLGSINEKSQSIMRAVEGSEDGIGQLVGINQSMLQALYALQDGISDASTMISRGVSYGGITAPSVLSGSEILGQAIDPFGLLGGFGDKIADTYLDYLSTIFTGGLIDIGKLLGGKSKKVDEGIRIIGGYIEDLIDETVVQAYLTYKVKKHALDDYDKKEKYAAVSDSVERQFALVFEGVYNSVVSAAEALGVDAAARASSFRVDTTKLSLEGLSASEQQAELEAYFSTVFDKMAGYTVPWLEDFQEAGEGLGETLSRLANYVLVTEEVVDRLGLQFSELSGVELVEASERLADYAGGLDNLITNMANFVDNFGTDSQKLELYGLDLARALGQLGLEVPETAAGYYDLLKAQDAATEEGARNVAMLLSLQSTANEYYTLLEDAQSDYYETELEYQQARLSEAEAALSAVESAIEGMTLAGSQAMQMAQRASALSQLEAMASTGRLSDSDTLSSLLGAATSISTSDYATFADYARDYASTAAVLDRLRNAAQETVDREQAMLDALQAQADAIRGLRDDLNKTQIELIKQSVKSANALERIEVDGVEIRDV